MSFPTSPTNGQTTTTNNITYTYSSVTNSWTRVPTTISLSSGTTGGTAASGTGTTTTFVISNTSQSTSTTTGALQVAGGVGIGGNVNIGGNLNVSGSITGSSVVVTVNQVTATSGVFYGDATGNGALYAGVIGYTPFAQTMFQATGNYNGYMEINVQNINSSSKGSADIVASANDVGINNGFIDMGITNSNWDGSQPYSLGTALTANDGYLMVGPNVTGGQGNLVLATATTGSNIKFLVQAINAQNSSTTVTNASIAMVVNPVGTVSTSTASGTLVTYGGVGVGGNLNVSGTVTGGGVRATTAASAPSNPTVGDIWYQSGTDVVYRYEIDGSGNTYWIDIAGPTVILNTTSVAVSGGGTFTGGTVANATTFSNVVVIGTGTTTATSVGLAVLTNDAVQLPVGTTAQRPSNPGIGMIRYNSSSTIGLEVFSQSNTSSYIGTWTSIIPPIYQINYLLVGGGGAGSNGQVGFNGAGGGGGGLITGTTSVIAGTQYTITVGAGAAAPASGSPANSSVGSGSSIPGLLLTVSGGGTGGGASPYAGVAGGSGGGGAGGGASPGTGGSGTPGQGYIGGTGSPTAPAYGAGGGGGASSAGINGSSSLGGNGGTGTLVTIAGTSTYYAGGGGGSTTNSTGWGVGGLGGGGNGANGSSEAGIAGTLNTGGGGGGSSGASGSTAGSQGGSGVVIISYANASQRAIGGSVLNYVANGTPFWVHTFTTSSVFTA